MNDHPLLEVCLRRRNDKDLIVITPLAPHSARELRGLRVKNAVLGSREVREGKKSAKGLR